jgi:hypothetical protein
MNLMSWYIILLLVLVLGSLISGLLMLLRTAKPLDLTPEQLEQIHQRELEQQAKDDAR